MLRTRNYALFLLLCAFLLVGIGSELIHPHRGEHVATLAVPFVPESERVIVASATLSIQPPLNREEKRQQLAAILKDTPLVSSPDAVVTVEEVPVVTVVDSISRTPQYCDSAMPGYESIPWAGQGTFAVVEGARVLLVASSTAPGVSSVVVQLPLPYTTRTQTYCIPQRLVGFNLAGLPLYNTDVSVWQSGPAGLLGYALDGMPIVRGSLQDTDECGGLLTQDGYVYIVTPEQESVIFCYREQPIRI